MDVRFSIQTIYTLSVFVHQSPRSVKMSPSCNLYCEYTDSLMQYYEVRQLMPCKDVFHDKEERCESHQGDEPNTERTGV